MAIIIVCVVLWLICGGWKKVTLFDKPESFETTMRSTWKGYENTPEYKDALEHARYMDSKMKKK